MANSEIMSTYSICFATYLVSKSSKSKTCFLSYKSHKILQDSATLILIVPLTQYYNCAHVKEYSEYMLFVTLNVSFYTSHYEGSNLKSRVRNQQSGKARYAVFKDGNLIYFSKTSNCVYIKLKIIINWVDTWCNTATGCSSWNIYLKVTNKVASATVIYSHLVLIIQIRNNWLLTH
jgi:hypothetical protein